MYPAGQKFREIFQLKRGSYADLPAAKISEMMHSNSLDVTSSLSPRMLLKFVKLFYLVIWCPFPNSNYIITECTNSVTS